MTLRDLKYSARRLRAHPGITAIAILNNRGGATTADFLDWRAHSEMIEDWHMFSYRGTFTATGAGLPERITYQHVTVGLLDSLGVKPVLG